MFWTSLMSRHADLVGRMADTLGVDLDEEIQKGRLPPQELRNSVLNCVACSNPDGCAVWLDAHRDGAGETPGFCRNKALLERMAATS